MNPGLLYEIIDSVTGERVYLGTTQKTLEQRMYGHYHAKTVVARWLAEHPHKARVVSRHKDIKEAVAKETRLLQEEKPMLNKFRTHWATGRALGSKNAETKGYDATIFVRCPLALKERLPELPGENDNDRVINALKLALDNNNKRTGART
jgi:predicted GIY-YIG superfamily endonuclease